MKKIAVVDPASYALTYDYQYLKALSNKYYVDFYCSSTKYNYDYVYKISQLSGVRVIEYQVSTSNKVFGLFNLIRLYFSILLKYNDYNSINVQWSVFPLIELPVYLILKSKLVYTFHNSKPHGCNNNTTLFNRFVSRISKVNLFVSDYTKNKFEIDYGFKSKKNMLLKHGVMPLTESGATYPRQEENKERNLNLVFWGNIKAYKGLDFLLDCLSFLKSKNILVKVYGKYDPELLYIHNELTSRGQVSNNNYLALDEVENILLNPSNLLVLPYRNSSQSGIMYNCLALGTPFICSNTGEAAKFLKEHDLEKLIFEYGNVESLLDSIDFFEKNKKLIIEKFKFLKGEYSWEYDFSYLEGIF